LSSNGALRSNYSTLISGVAVKVDIDSASRKPGIFGSLSRLFSGRKRVTEEEFHELMEASEEEGLINEEESGMIRAIFALGETVVREVMVPRTDMACISVDAGTEELIATIIACGHSRIPVYDGTVDNITGILYAKDLLKHWGDSTPDLDIRKSARPPFYIPETKNLEELLQEFKKRRVHLAIVIDEYGGTSGLITIEDLLEQIVGDIQDEYDREEELIQFQPDGSTVVDARLPIEEFEQLFEIEIEREKFDTVGGLIFYLLGRVPRTGDEVSGSGIRFTVLSAGERRIGKLRAERIIEADREPVQA
jgi:CBS domain containing-hemolysin-like protein